MPSNSRLYSKDEELGKRDDDFRPKKSSTWFSSMLPWRWRKRKVLAVLAVTFLVYVLVQNMPSPLGSIEDRLGVPFKSGQSLAGSASDEEPSGAPPRQSALSDDGASSQHYYGGPVKFYKLAMSLHGIARTMGARPQNRNVLFAVSSLQSAANLMPMACEMAKWDRNHVHMAFLGRDSLPLEDILEVNGVKEEDCNVYFHDARSDYSEYSTDRRAEVAVGGAMKHVNEFMHPQAIIMDDSSVEDAFFTRAMRGKAKAFGCVLIEVPSGRYEEFLWVTRLDSGSLSNWFKPNIDILIHALPDSSGGLLRVIESLKDAEYGGLKIPRLTIEVPSDIESFAQRYLADLTWPPGPDESPIKSSTLTLRHRISSSRVSSEQASLRFLESFYPADIANDHVFVLSPQAELSPLYLQYLHYTILEYHYSSYGAPGSEEMLGMSLDVPSVYLNGTGGFVAPTEADMSANKYDGESAYERNATLPFLYQAPSSTASLIFGNKWATIHNFLSHRLASSHLGKADRPKKLVSEAEPAWLEYVLELMRVRGWSMLHPPSPLVTVHNELAQIPEEYLKRQEPNPKKSEGRKRTDHAEEEAFLTADASLSIVAHIERNSEATQPLHDILPFAGDLPELPHLPYMSHTGDLINSTTATRLRNEYVPVFRRTIGGCEAHEASRKRLMHDLRTDDLFCLPGIEMEYDDDDDSEIAPLAETIAAETAGLHSLDTGGGGGDAEAGAEAGKTEAKSVKTAVEAVGPRSVTPAAVQVKTDAERAGKQSTTPTAVAGKKASAGAEKETQVQSKETHTPGKVQGEAVAKPGP